MYNWEEEINIPSRRSAREGTYPVLPLACFWLARRPQRHFSTALVSKSIDSSFFK